MGKGKNAGLEKCTTGSNNIRNEQPRAAKDHRGKKKKGREKKKAALDPEKTSAWCDG